VSWQVASLVLLAIALAAGFAWFERDRPPARVVAVVAALAALAVVGRLAFAAFPNVKPTTDIVLFAGYALGALPGFAVGAVTAIVSNIFLSHGPWTVWQMAGWGAVGVAGAALARILRGKEPNRWVLAAVCGAAGLAFGAWMDVYQWTLAARQDLDTYVAVAGTSLPYNLAHAAGNVVFCLLIGPAFLRALARYRRRLEVRWVPAPAALGVLLALLLAVPAVASAATPADRAERYLLRSQNEDGGFGPARGQSSSPLFTGWAGLALGSADHNPRDVKRRGGRTIARYTLRGSSSVRDIGEIERTVLLLRVGGLDPRSFGGRDLIAEIERRRRDDGSISGFVSYTAFGVMALRSVGASAGSSTVRWLVESQNEDGGFGVARSSTSDSDMTGATLQALAKVGRRNSGAAQRAVQWLRDNQNDDGGFGQFRGRPSNTQSTAYAIQGLLAVGAGGATLSRARAYITGLQRADGSVAYSSSSNQTPIWVTAQALMALEGKPLPLAAVPRKKRPPKRANAAAEESGGADAGGASGKGGEKKGGDSKPNPGGAGASAGGVAVVGGAEGATETEPGTATSSTPAAEAAVEQAARVGTAPDPKPVPVWAGILAIAGLAALLWALHKWVLPRRPDAV
jgi:Prenyltransferase and squalene oxidase repeat